MLPYVAGRLNRIGSDVELSLDAYLRTRFFTDTVSLTPGALQMAIDTYGRDRVLYATDFPFENLPRLCAFIAETAGDDYEAIRSNVIPGFLD
jgi:predicted TIM-barrel fold metal-dependent hydrolase